MNSNVGWTAQSKHAFISHEGPPGQTFTENQLPNPDVQRASGINPDQYRRQHGLYYTPAADTHTFVGTETGKAPTDLHQSVGNLESFMSVPVVVIVEEPVKEDKPVPKKK